VVVWDDRLQELNILKSQRPSTFTIYKVFLEFVKLLWDDRLQELMEGAQKINKP
jgi:hypothetical protein